MLLPPEVATSALFRACLGVGLLALAVELVVPRAVHRRVQLAVARLRRRLRAPVLTPREFRRRKRELRRQTRELQRELGLPTTPRRRVTNYESLLAARDAEEAAVSRRRKAVKTKTTTSKAPVKEKKKKGERSTRLSAIHNARLKEDDVSPPKVVSPPPKPIVVVPPLDESTLSSISFSRTSPLRSRQSNERRDRLTHWESSLDLSRRGRTSFLNTSTTSSVERGVQTDRTAMDESRDDMSSNEGKEEAGDDQLELEPFPRMRQRTSASRRFDLGDDDPFAAGGSETLASLIGRGRSRFGGISPIAPLQQPNDGHAHFDPDAADTQAGVSGDNSEVAEQIINWEQYVEERHSPPVPLVGSRTRADKRTHDQAFASKPTRILYVVSTSYLDKAVLM